MPILLRRYTFKEIKKFYEEQKESYQKNTSSGNQKIIKPNISPKNSKVKKVRSPIKYK